MDDQTNTSWTKKISLLFMLIHQGFYMYKKIVLAFFCVPSLYSMSDETYHAECHRREQRIQSAQNEYSSTHSTVLTLKQEVIRTEQLLDSHQSSLINDQQNYVKQQKELSDAIQNFDPESIPTKLEKLFREQESICQKKIKGTIQGHQQKQEAFELRLQEHTVTSKDLQKTIATLKKSIKNKSQKLIKLQACIALFNSEETTPSAEAPPSYETCEKTSEEVCLPGPSAPSEDAPPGYVQAYGSYDKTEA